MKYLWIAALVLFTTWSGPAAACTCGYGGPFSKVAAKGDLVVVGQVLSHHGHGMQLEVLQVLKGKEERQRITIWGDAGMSCRDSVGGFPDGTRWVISMFLLPPQGMENDSKNLPEPLPETVAGKPYYALGGCATYSLEVKGETAYGPINDKSASPRVEEAIPLSELARWLKRGGRGKLKPVTRPLESLSRKPSVEGTTFLVHRAIATHESY